MCKKQEIPAACDLGGVTILRIILLLCLFLSDSLWAKLTPSSKWDFGMNLPGINYAIDMISSNTGCIFLCDIMNPDSTYASQLVWVNAKGQMERVQRYDSSHIAALDVTKDGRLLLCGQNLRHEAEIMVADSTGQILWQKSYSYGPRSRFTHAVHLSDGGFIAVGDTTAAHKGAETTGLAVRMNDAGIANWAIVYGSMENVSSFKRVSVTTDGGFLFIGTTKAAGKVRQDAVVVKVDQNGKELQRHYCGTTWSNVVADAQILSNGTTVVAGRAEPPEAWRAKVFLMLLNSNGDTLWFREYASQNDTSLTTMGVTESPNGDLIVVGQVHHEGAPPQIMVMGIDLKGHLKWLMHEYEPFTSGTSIVCASDGGCYLGGMRLNSGEWDAYLVKTGPDVPEK